MLRYLPILLLVILLAGPFLLEPAGEAADPDAPRLVVVTPHNEQIRWEFKHGFEKWHEARFGSPVQVVWSTPGGTSEIRKLLVSEYTAALDGGLEPGGNADLLWGGGSYEFTQLSRPISVDVDGGIRDTTILAEIDVTDDWLESIYGDGQIADQPLFDPGHRWFGTAVSSFGIVFNRHVLEQLDVKTPETWQDLAVPQYEGWITMVDPGMSGSVTTAFEAILQRRGWDDGWRILRRLAANARSFAGSSTKGPIEVAAGETAAAVCIDFYGRYEAQRTKDAAVRAGLAGADAIGRVGYVDPPGETVIDPDPIAVLTGAPNPELARRFIDFVLSEDGQSLWQFPVSEDARGPRQFELRRLPIRRSMYDADFDRFVDRVDPWSLATAVENPNGAMRAFIAPLFRAMALDQAELLEEAWRRITSHPAYPASSGELVTAGNVEDPELRRMLVEFDSFPVIPGPDDASYDLADPSTLATVKKGWLRRGWADEGLWPSEGDPTEILRRIARAHFRSAYRSIIDAKRPAG
ncbi:MAG: hypothetical protein CMJ52_03535 [Planctomycetaceae bacterium]|nr:hypothetical protein [Planctomycetaceae bacterium]